MLLAPQRNVLCLVHGDDFLLAGTDADLDWASANLRHDILLKDGGRLGGGAKDAKEIRCLNRVLRWTHAGYEVEADPRHAEILGAMLGGDRRVVSTPGVKEKVEAPRGQVRPAEEEEDSAFEERMSARTAKVRDLQQQIRDLAAQLAERRGEEVNTSGAPVGHAQEGALAAVAVPKRASRGEAEEEHQGADAPKPREDEADRVLTEVEAGWFRGAAARANYLAQDRFDLAFAAKELCRRMAVPRHSDLAALRRLARYVLEVPRLVQCFQWQEPTGEFVVYTDTDFAGCPRTRRSTNGGAIVRGSHLIKHYSKTQKVVTPSSAEAELGGIVHGATEGLGVQSVAADLGIVGSLRLRADAQAAIGICRRSGIGRARHLAVGQLWIQERIREGTIALEKVAGEANPADAATKHLAGDRLRKCYAALNCEARAGRSDAAPALAADVEPFLREAGGPRNGAWTAQEGKGANAPGPTNVVG